MEIPICRKSVRANPLNRFKREKGSGMDKHEFEQFVTEHGKDILRFCRMNAESTERGNELYQDTMVKLLEKQKKLDAAQNIKSYAMQTAILLWEARKIRRRNRHF